MSVNIPILVAVESATPVRTESITVREIRWIGATTAGDLVSITDPNGKLLWDSVAAGANYVEADIILREWPLGFVVPILDSGLLRIYVDRGKAE